MQKTKNIPLHLQGLSPFGKTIYLLPFGKYIFWFLCWIALPFLFVTYFMIDSRQVLVKLTREIKDAVPQINSILR